MIKTNVQIKNTNIVDNIIEIINNEYQDYSFNVSTLLKKSSYYPDRIRDVLYLEMQITPFVLIENIRIEKSLYFLYENTTVIKEAFRLVGYSSARVFRNAFKKRVGFSPSELKHRVIDEKELKILVVNLWQIVK